VAVRIDPNQPAIVMWLFPYLVEKILEVIEPELNTAIMEVLSHTAVGIQAEASLALIRPVCAGGTLGSRLPVLNVRGAGVEVVATA
jgi:hypothetical protein